MSEFDEWNKRKKYIHAKHERVFYHEREIRWCKLGKNIGFEEGGRGKDFDRPVLILKAFSRETCLVVPLTSSKNKHKFRFIIDDNSTAILS
jgi:mRNA interferase MazF